MVPGPDIEAVVAQVPELMALFDVAEHQRQVGRFGHAVLTQPDDPIVTELILDALRERRPFSAVRIGDGEMNLLAVLDPASQTAALDAWAARASMAQQADRCLDDLDDLRRLGTAIQSSVVSADIVGLVGLWMPGPFAAQTLVNQLSTSPRGALGQIAARRWGRGIVRDLEPQVTIATAHFYVAVLQGLDALVQAARRVVCVTDRESVVARVRRRSPSADIAHLPVGRLGPASFDAIMTNVGARIAQAQPGDLYLIGAGPWAEPYCAMARDAGAVGVDLGSGFDLIDGAVTRPVHKALAVADIGQRYPDQEPPAGAP